MACSKSFTNDEIKRRIQNVCTKFVVGVEPDRLSDWLVQENVITSDQWQRIHSDNPTRQSRCRALLHHLNSIPHPRAFLVVRQALVEENHYLLESIDNQETGSEISSLPDIQTALQETEKKEQEDYEEKKRVWEEEKDRILKIQNEHEHQKRAWEKEKDRLVKIQKEYENQKRELEEEKERLLNMKKDFETKLHLDSIKQQKLEQERNAWCKEKEQLLKQIQELQQSLDAEDQEHSISEIATIDVSNIPEDMSKDILLMIFEVKRFGGGDVTTIVYEKGQGSAVITLSDPEVAKRLVRQESVIYKGSRLMITKHVEEDRSKIPFPPRKRNNVPSSAKEKEQPSISDRRIKVSNIPSGVNKDTLEMMFENRRRGGGETDDIVYDQQQGIAVITFKDTEVAKTLIQKEVLTYKGTHMAITRSVEEPLEDVKQELTPSVSSRMVDVSEIPPDMTVHMLTMLLEYSSGSEIESIDYNQNRTTAVATFKDSVAANVLISKESVVYKGKQLFITRHVGKANEIKNIPREKEEHPSSSNRTIFVSQIPQQLNKDYLVMIFEMKRYGGGRIEEIDLDPEHGTAVVTFEDPKIAASFVEKEVLEFKGQRMLITKHEDQAADAGRGGDTDDNASAKQQPSPISAVSGSFNTVKVSGISKDTSKDVISMYFESKRRSGGGKLTVLEYQKEKGKAVIMFKSPADGLEVCKRIHVLSGATLKISALEMSLDDVKSCAIEVKGLSERATENYLELYFENRSRNGSRGGPVENVFFNKEDRSAIIVFEEATAVMGVMKKRPHKLDGAILEVNILEPAPPPPLLVSDVDTNRLLAKRLPPSSTKESLWEYLSPAAGAKMVDWKQAVKPTTALLHFTSEPDYLSIRRLVCSKPFLGKMISIRRVPLTSSILVTGMPSYITADFIAMYFENPRNGGTGEECKVKMLPDKVSAIVEFQRPDVIARITSRRHHFEKKEVKVEPYYPWLG